MTDLDQTAYIKTLEQALSNVPCSVTYAFFDASRGGNEMAIEKPFAKFSEFLTWRDACGVTVEIFLIEFSHND